MRAPDELRTSERNTVIPAKAGIQVLADRLDSGFRRNDGPVSLCVSASLR